MNNICLNFFVVTLETYILNFLTDCSLALIVGIIYEISKGPGYGDAKIC